MAGDFLGVRWFGQCMAVSWLSGHTEQGSGMARSSPSLLSPETSLSTTGAPLVLNSIYEMLFFQQTWAK